ncbi:uncharacterized protein C20orf85 homolog [Thrips palmi]|uniref:Uncharacterized protein C20orf85 homolog n=1 Tax=Thrips palmi TaxID=161013 RepID=A0A6P9AJT9_THRPL|nr:uncharacterized protein C20orf85 homolog [Thrips palmi]
MAVSDQDLKHFGVAAEEIWKARVVKEKLIASQWPVKWSWMVDEYNVMAKQLDELKNLRPVIGRPKPVEIRSCKPMPDTSSRVIGWLTNRPEFRLELYGPYVKKYPIFPPPID